MGVPTSEVGYTPAMSRREDHEVHKDMWWHWTKIKTIAEQGDAPHKQKAETYKSASGQKKNQPPPHSNGELQKQKNNGHK